MRTVHMCICKQINTEAIHKLINNRTNMYLWSVIEKWEYDHNYGYNQRCHAYTYMKCPWNPLPQNSKGCPSKSRIQCKGNAICCYDRTNHNDYYFFRPFCFTHCYSLLLFLFEFLLRILSLYYKWASSWFCIKESAKTNIYSIHERRCLLQILYIIQHSYTTSLKN